MNNLEFNDVYNQLVFTEYEQDDFSYIDSDMSITEIPGEEDYE